MNRALSRRQFLIGTGGLAAVGLIAACGTPPAPAAMDDDEAEGSGLTGELTIDMQYVPGKVTADTPVALHEILHIAAEYEEMHPGVEVTFEEPWKATEAMTQPTYFKAGAAAGTLPDITFMYGLSFIYDKDAIIATTEYLDQPNHYMPSDQPGHERWVDQWYDDVQPLVLADGNNYDIPMGWGNPGLVIAYNKEMYAEAGLSGPPEKTYYDYYQTCQQILDAGMIPLESTLLSWEWDRMVDYLVRSMGLFELIDLNGDGFCTDVEQTRAAIAGIVRFDSPYWVEPTRIWKEVTNYFQPGYLQMAQTTNAIGYGEIFMTEQSSMVWHAVRIWPQLMELGGTDKFGVFNLPRLTNKLTPWGEEDPTWLIARSTESKTVTRTARERGHVDLAIDFLKFMTTPANSERLIQERFGTNLVMPTIRGLEGIALDDDVKALVSDYEKKTAKPGFSSDRIGDWHFWYEWFSALQAYFADAMTLEEMIQVQIDVLPTFIDNFLVDKELQEEAKEWEKLRADYTPPPWGEYTVPTEPFVMPFNA